MSAWEMGFGLFLSAVLTGVFASWQHLSLLGVVALMGLEGFAFCLGIIVLAAASSADTETGGTA